jgi:hypothetical protein
MMNEIVENKLTKNETIETKICNKCNIEKPIHKYRKYNEYSYRNTCKYCDNEIDKLRKKNARQKNLQTTLAICELCNQDKTLNNFVVLKKYYKRKICKLCYPSFLRKQKMEWESNQRNSNVNYRIKKSLAARLRNVLSKNDTTMNYIGCNIQYLREWFEYNFTEEMNWNNYGTFWSIDHIIPVCKFDLTNEIEKLKCWNWTNLMPVTIKYNSSKKQINMEQINYIIEKIQKFKEEGSTTKWFSEEFTLNMELVESKINVNSF